MLDNNICSINVLSIHRGLYFFGFRSRQGNSLSVLCILPTNNLAYKVALVLSLVDLKIHVLMIFFREMQYYIHSI